MPKERPILFSGAMVRAILSGQKTVTRRPVKRLALQWLEDGFEPGFVADPGNAMCPYGQPGERLWVRESFADLRGTGIEHRPDPGGPLQRYAFAADSPPGSASDEARKDFGIKWKPSIHMPRSACRILLEITAVRVERLNVLNRGDAMAEGCPFPNMAAGPDPRQWFAELWQEINGAESWHANPWVWVVEFKRVTP